MVLWNGHGSKSAGPGALSQSGGHVTGFVPPGTYKGCPGWPCCVTRKLRSRTPWRDNMAATSSHRARPVAGLGSLPWFPQAATTSPVSRAAPPIAKSLSQPTGSNRLVDKSPGNGVRSANRLTTSRLPAPQPRENRMILARVGSLAEAVAVDGLSMHQTILGLLWSHTRESRNR